MVTKVLIGENEALVAMDLQMILTHLGYDVVGIGASGESIMKINKELHPDIILMDIRLDGTLNGFQTAEKIQQKDNVPILFVTAGTETTSPNKAAMVSFLRKPFSDERLEQALVALLKRHRGEIVL